MIELYHRTSPEKAQTILARGLRVGTDLFPSETETMQDFSGIWLSDKPHEKTPEHAALLRVRLDMSEAALSEYQWNEEGKTHREWLVPATLITAYGAIELVTEEAPATSRRQKTGRRSAA